MDKLTKQKENSMWTVYAVATLVLLGVTALVYMLFINEEDFQGIKIPEPPNLYTSSKYVIGTGNKLSTYFPAGQIMANYFTDHQENKKAGFIAEITDGSMENISLIQTKQIHFGMSESRIAKEAYANNKDIRIVWPLWLDVAQILIPPKDLSCSFPGTGTAYLGQRDSATARVSREILSALGYAIPPEANITPDSVIDRLGKGGLNFAMIKAGIPNDTVFKAIAFYRCQLVSFTLSQLDLIRNKVTTSVNYTIPADYYDERQPEITTIALPNVLIATKDTPNELVEFVVENLIKCCDKYKNRFKTFETVPTDKNVILKIIERTGVPLHEGTKLWLEKTPQILDNSGENK